LPELSARSVTTAAERRSAGGGPHQHLSALSGIDNAHDTAADPQQLSTCSQTSSMDNDPIAVMDELGAATAAERAAMVERQLRARGIRDERVLAAMSRVPRELFVPPALRDKAYADGALQIGEGQTISQPYIVALMSEALGLEAGDKVLELGTGSGYQTAVLATMGAEVYTIERLPTLSLQARQILDRLGFRNIHYRVGDGTLGWPEAAPFDGIIVTAMAPSVPEPLLEQLADCGRMVIPIGTEERQMLKVVERHGDSFDYSDLCPCVFVKLIGKAGWPD